MVEDKYAWITEYHTFGSSRALLITLIDFLALSEKDPKQWPALETILHRALAAEEARVWELVEARMQKVADAYPTDVFIEPPVGQHGQTIDACSARMGRHLGKILLAWCRQRVGGG